MTAIVTRSPLQHLSMNGAHTNNNKRRSARHAFEDDDAPPTKKSKGETGAATTTKVALANGNGKATGGRANGAVRSKAKKSYEEQDDGFAFSRTRSKRGKAKEAEPEPAPAQAAQPEPEQEPQPKPAPTTQKKRTRKTLPTTPESDRDNAPKRRRSKRLSGENEQAQDDPFSGGQAREISMPPPRSTPGAQVVEHEQSPLVAQDPEAQKLHVEKKRRVTKIALPFADTPIIRRNKEMRKNSAEQHRRSSSGMRGRRASSLIDAGTSNALDLNVEAAETAPTAVFPAPSEVVVKPEEAQSQTVEDILADILGLTAVPHAEVETSEFYKHISQDLTEPRRMRQLLMWCGHRALPEKPRGNMDKDEANAIHAARAIQNELLNEFGSRNDMSNWFDREDTAPAVLVKKPNPRNVQNAAKLQELEAELARLQAEKRSWDELLASTNPAKQPAQTDSPPSLDPSSLDASLLDPSQSEILQSLLSVSGPHPTSSDLVSETKERLANVTESLEFKIDQFADGMHRLEQYTQVADRVADQVLAAASQKLEERDRERRERSGNVDSIDVLRGLSRAMQAPKRE
ncbi:hypothetical protein M8818_001913 [Zalaria obscura]|uniref:Uncharacterized protein n=1 Tax=Zalaria obscura TaxID=2024903 RepID=A0ACC3SIG5_9PEZI